MSPGMFVFDACRGGSLSKFGDGYTMGRTNQPGLLGDNFDVQSSTSRRSVMLGYSVPRVGPYLLFTAVLIDTGPPIVLG